MARSSWRSRSKPSTASIWVCRRSILFMRASILASGSPIAMLTCQGNRRLPVSNSNHAVHQLKTCCFSTTAYWSKAPTAWQTCGAADLDSTAA